jgi:hypothetical protein
VPFSDAAVQAPGTRGHLPRYLAAMGLGLAVWWLVYRELSPLAHWMTESVLGLDAATR